MDNTAPNSDYMIISNNEAASVINRFAPDMIRDVVEEAMNSKYKNYSLTLANTVESLETEFKMQAAGLPEYSTDILAERDSIYRQIIGQVCAYHGLGYFLRDEDDIYSAAYYIYDFLVSRFNVMIVNFFINYIIREKSMINDVILAYEDHRQPSVYGKKIFPNDVQLALIYENIEFVLNNISVYDIDLHQFVQLAYKPDMNTALYLNDILIDNGDFYKRVIAPYFQYQYANLTTLIKIQLQGFGDGGAEYNLVM